MSRFFCLWIEQFPAWAAAYNDASLQGKTLLIYQEGRVLSASPNALHSGVRIGWPLPRAQYLVPDAVAVSYHAPTVQAVWQDVLDSLYGLSPFVESLRLGLALADLNKDDKVRPFLRQWKVRGGLADNRIAAELAAYTSKPGELQVVPPLGNVRFLQTVPLKFLREAGVRHDTLERLHLLGWSNAYHLRPLTQKQMLAQFDQGELLFRYGQCDDCRPVAAYSPPPIIETHHELEEALCEPGELKLLLGLLVQEAASQLEGKYCHSLVVRLQHRLGNSVEWLRAVRVLPDATADVRVLTRASWVVLHSLLRPGLSIRRVEVQLGRLAYPQPVQEQLFGRKRASIQKAIAMLERRYPGVLKRIVMIDANSYLPEKAFRLEPLSTAKTRTPKTVSARKKRTTKGIKSKTRTTTSKTPSFPVSS